MEQNSASGQAILYWLADSSHLICDSLSLPHEQGNRLLQQYLDLTKGTPPQQAAPSPYEQPTSLPEIPSSHHSSEQLMSAHLATHLRDTPSSYPAPPNSNHESRFQEEADSMAISAATTARFDAPLGPFYLYDQQSGDLLTTGSNDPENSALSPLLTEPPNKTPVGRITDYDPLWVQHNNFDTTMVEKLRSKMKFDTVFSQEVIKTGDILTFQISVSANAQHLETEAHLKGRLCHHSVGHLSCLTNQIIGSSNCRPRGWFSDLSVTLLSDPSRQYPTLKTSTGTTAMIEHLRTSCNMMVLKPASQDIQVLCTQQALGNMWWVKQAFHLWRDRKDQETQETGQFFRTRLPPRTKGGSGCVVHHNGRFGVWEDGNFVPDPDQGRYRPRG